MPSFGEVDAWLRKHRKSHAIRKGILSLNGKDKRFAWASNNTRFGWWQIEDAKIDMLDELLADMVEWCGEEYRKHQKSKVSEEARGKEGA